MKSVRMILACALLVSFASHARGPEVWNGAGIQIQPAMGSAQVTMNCAQGSISNWNPPSDGQSVSSIGSYVRKIVRPASGPRIGIRPPRPDPAVYTLTNRNGALTVKIEVGGHSGKILEFFGVKKDAREELSRCTQR